MRVRRAQRSLVSISEDVCEKVRDRTERETRCVVGVIEARCHVTTYARQHGFLEDFHRREKRGV